MTNKQKVALITGITGQDGSYLAELLLSEGHKVVGLRKRSSTVNTERIDHLYQDPQLASDFSLEYGDVSDMTSLMRVIAKHEPDEVYNLAAQSHVRISFENPSHTLDSIGHGSLFIYETVKSLGLIEKTRIYQASTSELFGGVNMPPKGYDETSRMVPMSPYGAAKQYGYTLARIYRDAYGMHISNGILFNHESPRRGKNFVTRKVAIGVAKIREDKNHCLYLGNLEAERDWGHAKDYVKGMTRILRATQPDDFVLATGKSVKIRHFVEQAFKASGEEIRWEGSKEDEVGILASGRVAVRIDPRYYRPLEVDRLKGNPEKARKILDWKAEISFEDLVKEMVEAELGS